MDLHVTNSVAPGLGGPPKAPPLHKLACLNHQPLHDALKGADGELEHHNRNNSTLFQLVDQPTRRLRQRSPQLYQRRPSRKPQSRTMTILIRTIGQMKAVHQRVQLPQPLRRRSDREARPTRWSRSPEQLTKVRKVIMFFLLLPTQRAR